MKGQLKTLYMTMNDVHRQSASGPDVVVYVVVHDPDPVPDQETPCARSTQAFASL